MYLFTMFDPLYWMLIGPTMLLALWAQLKVKSTFATYSKVGNSSNMTGAQAANEMLRREGVNDCKIEMIGGTLSDHYDPRDKVLRLSSQIYNGRSVAAVGIACHEAGHALQHAQSYAFLGLRSALVPVAQFGSSAAWIFIFAGMFLSGGSILGISGLAIAKLGVILFSAGVLFQVVTLPVEFNASSRAKDALVSNCIIVSEDEITGVNKVLDAAAMTYIAATIAALAQLLYWVIRLGILGGSSDD